jgi:hypothetical protein
MTCPKVPIKKKHLRWLVLLPLPAWFHSAEAVCLHSGVNSLTSTRHIGRTTFQCKFVWVFFFFTCNIICEQLINISLILFIFRFTNIEATRVITSPFKSSMEIYYFNGVRFLNILIGDLISMYSFENLRLVLTSNFIYF